MTKRAEKVASRLSEVLEDLTFLPTPEQRKVKAAFYATFSDAPTCEASEIGPSLAFQLTGDYRVNRWWKIEGFREWFQNRDEFKQRMEYLAHLSLDTLEQLLISDETTSAAKVNAIKIIIEAANKMPAKYKQEKLLDADISRWSKEQLDEYVRAQTRRIQPAREDIIADTNTREDVPDTVSSDSGE